MNIFKQLDKLVIKSFIGPYLIAFVVAEFVLVLQFIWRYIDDFIGRGVSPFIISEMVFYYSITIIPLAVPISILISSVMVYGNMAEKYELTSFKSAGVSLYRIMRPGIIIAILTGLFSIFSSNYLKPKANLLFYQTFDNVRRAKPTLTIDQGIFNYDFKGFAIRVGKKYPDGKKIEDVLIYDQTDRRLMGLITAKSGEMYISEDGRFFTMELNDGVQYTEMERKSEKGKRDQDQFVRVYFKKYIKQFDMSEFEFSISSNNLNRRKHDLYNSFQMAAAIDSIENKMKEQLQRNMNNFNSLLKTDEIENDDDNRSEEDEDESDESINEKISDKDNVDELKRDSASINGNRDDESRRKNDRKRQEVKTSKISQTKSTKEFQQRIAEAEARLEQNKNTSNLRKTTKLASRKTNADRYYKERINFRNDTISIDTVSSLINTVLYSQRRNILFRAKSSAQTTKERYRTIVASNKSSLYNRNKFELRLHQQLCWAVICVIFLFIGAPLGSIVRKGGFGYPLLIAIVFFVIFIFTNIMGEKLVNNGTFDPVFGAWFPCIILTPFAFYFTWKAIRDSKFDFNFNIFSWFSS